MIQHKLKMLATIKEQVDLIRLCIDQRIYVKMRFGVEIRGRLQVKINIFLDCIFKMVK